jgi:regulator of replication initiation timing
MKSANADAILELIGDLVRERNQLRQTVGGLKSELAGLQIERDELLVKLRRLEAAHTAAKDNAANVVREATEG